MLALAERGSYLAVPDLVDGSDDQTDTGNYRAAALELFGDLAYCYLNGPLVADMEAVFETGLNCQLLVHLALDELFPHLATLPKDWRSSELFADGTRLKWIRAPRYGQAGDICFLGRREWCPQLMVENQDAQSLHLGLLLEPDPDPWILHASYVAGKVVVERLSEITRHARYQRLFAIKRILV